jgi:hypothetical protein
VLEAAWAEGRALQEGEAVKYATSAYERQDVRDDEQQAEGMTL